MSSSLSGITFTTSLTSHASWNKLTRTLHISNDDIVDELQLKARMQQRHHRVLQALMTIQLSIFVEKIMLSASLKIKIIMCTK